MTDQPCPDTHPYWGRCLLNAGHLPAFPGRVHCYSGDKATAEALVAEYRSKGAKT